jgi:hypothetical protein
MTRCVATAGVLAAGALVAWAPPGDGGPPEMTPGTAGIILAITGLLSTATPLVLRAWDTKQLGRDLGAALDRATAAESRAVQAERRVAELESLLAESR